MAAATAALASRFASSRDLVATAVGRGASFAGAWAALVGLDCRLPLTGTEGLAAGLKRGIAGTIRPDLGPIGTDLAAVGSSAVTAVTGGANASTTFGFDSIGGGGPFVAFVGGAGVVAVLGNLTVATGFSRESS